MFGFVAKITLKRVCVALGVILVPILIFTAVRVYRAGREVPVVHKAETAEQRLEFLSRFGWEIEEGSEAGRDIIIPAEFDRVYESYNQIQISQGFDLSGFSGQTVRAYNYRILNYRGDYDNVYATVIVTGGRVIGGDVHSTERNGFLHGFSRSPEKS